jgi:hypothetical protein
MGEKWSVNLACDPDSHVNHRVLLHAAKLRHGTDGFSSPPKEGMLRNFSPEKSDGFGRIRTRELGYQRRKRGRERDIVCVCVCVCVCARACVGRTRSLYC